MDIIEINGVSYYVPVEYSSYIIEVGNTLTLSKTGNITLYSNLVEYGVQNSGYPRIQLQYGNKARYITRTGQQTITQDLVVNSWEFVNKNKLADPYISLYILVVISGAVIWKLFKR